MKRQLCKSMQRACSIFLVLTMIVTILPVGVFAENESDSVIEISTVEDLYNVRNDLAANYILMNDIDLTAATAEGGDWDFMGNGWNPIGSGDIYGSGAFSGVFDGNGHTIIGLRIDATTLPSGTGSSVCLGLFANVTGTVKNLKITGSINYQCSKDYYIGSITGKCGGTIENCVNHTDICGDASTYGVSGYVGGIIGSSTATARILNCVNNGDITSDCYAGSSAYDYAYAGGIVGLGSASTAISNSYNTGMISAKAVYWERSIYGYAYAAGITKNATITDCYNTGEVDATGRSKYTNRYAYGIGGTATRCYNVGNTTAVDGRYGISDSTSTNCYYLSGTGSNSNGATSLTETQMRLQTMYAGFDFVNTWTLNSDANHPYPQLIDNIQSLDESVSIVSIISWPIKTEYMTGDELELDGCAINVIYVSGRTELLNVTAEMVSGYDNTKAGEQIITVTYLDGNDTFPVTVRERPQVSAIELISQPKATAFLIGTAFDFTGAQIKVTYSDSTTEVIDVTLDMTSGGNIYHLGKQTITISFHGMTDTFEVTVMPVAISSLLLETKPDKLTYLEGENLDLTGMQLAAIMNNGTKQQITSGYSVSGYSTEPGTHTVKISYMGKYVELDVTVEDKAVVSLTLKAAPTKTTYVAGEAFDPSGMMIVATFDNGDIEAVEDYVISGFDDVPGLKTVVVSYGDKYVAFSVTIIPRVIIDFRIASYPAKIEYLQNEVFDPTGLKVEATYNDGITEEVTDYEVVGFSSNPGTHTVSVAYAGWVETFTIHVTARTMTSLLVVPPTKLAYYLNEAFDNRGMTVTACYNNGQQVSVEDYSVSGFDSSAPGTKAITVTYNGFTSSFSVSISERSEIETEGSFRVGTCVGRLGETVVIPVSVFKNTGIAGFKHAITFDINNLQFVSAEAVGAYENGTVVVNDEEIAQGKVTVLWFDTHDVVNDGAVYQMTFKILEKAADGVTDISIAFDENDNGNVSGENVLFDAMNGSVEVLSYWLGDLNGDRLARVADLLKLAQYTAGKQMTLTAKQLLAADVNEDKVIDIHDVILLQQWILDDGVQTADSDPMLGLFGVQEDIVKIAVGEVKGKVGQEVVVPVTIKDNTGISAFLFEVEYNANDLVFVSAENGKILNKGSVATKVNEERQTITILWYSAEGDVDADGEIVPLMFKIKDTASGDYDLKVRYAADDVLNEDNGVIPCAIMDGKIEISSIDGVEVALVDQTDTTATITLTSYAEDKLTACIITASYDVDGKLLDSTFEAQVFNPQDFITATIHFSTEADSLKIFVLEADSFGPSQIAKSFPVK